MSDNETLVAKVLDTPDIRALLQGYARRVYDRVQDGEPNRTPNYAMTVGLPQMSHTIPANSTERARIDSSSQSSRAISGAVSRRTL